jgi:hypothetical protein
LQLQNLDDIASNFRVKEVYASKNAFTQIRGLSKFKFLQVMLVADNQLRDLEKFIEFLQNFAFLEQLDLYGNPLAEEPDYRQRLIHAMPQIKILDRHMVTLQERQKAQKVVAAYHGKREKKQRKPPVDEKSKGFSTGEKDLYREIGNINRREEAEKSAEAARTAAFFAKKSYGRQMPVPSKKAENKDKFGNNSEIALIEWEKNQIKPLFRSFDKEKKGIEKADLIKIMSSLADDECIIGKIPYVSESEFEGLFTEWPEKTTWEHFRENCNQWEWRMVPYERLSEVVNEYFTKAYKYKMQGKDNESRDMTTKALRLQGSLTKTKPIQPEPKKVSELPPRNDTFKKTILRREGNVGPDEDPENTRTIDKTAYF